jgi:phosphoribosylformylglycinamidine synthase subunit PurQ / glutaminase
MTQPSALIICGDGINCDVETAYALESSGFNCSKMYANQLWEADRPLANVQLLVIPGGFAFGDEIASGKVLALKLKQRMQEEIFEFIDSGRLLMGICNGFQVLTQLGVLPFSSIDKLHAGRLAKNSSGKFINRWVGLKVNPEHPSLFLAGLESFELPIRHGEGRFEVSDGLSEGDLKQLSKQFCLNYTQDVNGSYKQVAALTNEKGNVFGIMPHPEAFVRTTQHPAWTEAKYGSIRQLEPVGRTIFQNVFKACAKL